MIPNDQPLRYEMIERMINYLMRSPHKLNDTFEKEFVTSVAFQFDAKGDLSQKQCEILERIYDK